MIFHNVTPIGLCSDFISAVLMGTVPGALNRLVLPVTSPILFLLRDVYYYGSSAKLDSLKNN